jgi:hypothetical protein
VVVREFDFHNVAGIVAWHGSFAIRLYSSIILDLVRLTTDLTEQAARGRPDRKIVLVCSIVCGYSPRSKQLIAISKVSTPARQAHLILVNVCCNR